MPEAPPGADAAVTDVDHLVESLALKQCGREAAALAPAAYGGDRAIPRQLVQPIDEIAVGDVQCPRHVTRGELIRIADVQDRDLVAALETLRERVEVDQREPRDGAFLRAPRCHPALEVAADP